MRKKLSVFRAYTFAVMFAIIALRPKKLFLQKYIISIKRGFFTLTSKLLKKLAKKY
jgi:hypothetical protein